VTLSSGSAAALRGAVDRWADAAGRGLGRREFDAGTKEL
jgi:hypothetical protein